MNLVSAYTDPWGPMALYLLLAERPKENFISHEQMPSAQEHVAFVRSKPFRLWLLIKVGEECVGAIEALDTNEMGIAIFKAHQRKGYARQAMELFTQTYKPLPAIPAKRVARWLANVAPGNEASKAFWLSLGAKKVQETYAI